MKRVIKAKKIHACYVCNGNIQKGEKYILEEYRYPKYNCDDKQIGVEYAKYRKHNKECFPRLLNYSATKEIIKNCNFGIHLPTYDLNPDSCDDNEYCKWCGKTL